jgi:cell division protein FtsL
MAIIGARPVTGPWFIPGRGRARPRRRPRSEPVRRLGRSRASRRTESRLDVRPIIVTIVVAAALALFYLSQSTRVAATGYEIDGLESILAARRAHQQQLISQIAQARSPAEITRRARTELRLVPLAPGAVTYAHADTDTAD